MTGINAFMLIKLLILEDLQIYNTILLRNVKLMIQIPDLVVKTLANSRILPSRGSITHTSTKLILANSLIIRKKLVKRVICAHLYIMISNIEIQAPATKYFCLRG